MTPQTLLHHIDSGTLWTASPQSESTGDHAAAYQQALSVRALRIARGEVPRGYKIGFTNRTIWPRYGVFAPIWGTVWDTTLTQADAAGVLSLANTCQPRIEPEAVFGMARTPPANASIEDLFASIEWIASGLEIVQSHNADWKFSAADTMLDSGLHARLLVGRKQALRDVAANALEFDAKLGACRIRLLQGEVQRDEGTGSNVLDSPLRALHHFLGELRACPGATDLRQGDVITTGTWTDAWPVKPGQTWTADFDSPMLPLTVSFR
jgi:2-keto-4-pentenoate hydratase